MSGDATRWLISQGVRLMGCDAITYDPPVWAMFEKQLFWEAHRVMWDEEYWHLENLMNLEQIGRPFGFHGLPRNDQERTPEGGLWVVAQGIAHRGQGVVHLRRGGQRLRKRGKGLRFQRLAIAGDEGLDRPYRQWPELEARRRGMAREHQIRWAPLVITLTV